MRVASTMNATDSAPRGGIGQAAGRVSKRQTGRDVLDSADFAVRSTRRISDPGHPRRASQRLRQRHPSMT